MKFATATNRRCAAGFTLAEILAALLFLAIVIPAAVEALADVLKTCRTLVWNGPLGAFETPPFDAATVALARTADAPVVLERLLELMRMPPAWLTTLPVWANGFITDRYRKG